MRTGPDHPDIELAPRMRTLPTRLQSEALGRIRLDFTGEDEGRYRVVDQAMFLGGGNANMVIAANAYRKTGNRSSFPPPNGFNHAVWGGPEFYLSRWQKLKGSWKYTKGMLFSIETYAIPIHDAICAFAKRFGLDLCREELPNTSLGHWIRTTEAKTAEASPSSDKSSETDSSQNSSSS
jgi:hypothetical protein